jgi:hypothetical protein
MRAVSATASSAAPAMSRLGRRRSPGALKAQPMIASATRPADQGAEHGRQPEDAAKNALVAAALARREEIADRRHRGHDQAAAAEPLQGAKDDQHDHRAAEPAQRRARQEDEDRRLQHDLAPEQIAQLAVKRCDDRRRQQVRGDDPRQVGQLAELADDCRQRGRDDRLV